MSKHFTTEALTPVNIKQSLEGEGSVRPVTVIEVRLRFVSLRFPSFSFVFLRRFPSLFTGYKLLTVAMGSHTHSPRDRARISRRNRESCACLGLLLGRVCSVLGGRFTLAWGGFHRFFRILGIFTAC